ncbi:alanine/glycine:cation symporter family protein [Marinitenerispora sediminis]|uniref:Sodium:alanine symporter family protein n=1 Tax=Marinitenerispora sediminis TaxID=1931232 RepID=A0A368TBN0_9ACTN|nr:sodium:alanine symporter family protein [Marinitenerispora sediminis]RCV57958.1 sodium:alanine symporter family protein [Marinitenerispora sediminis]RCV62309.1 sodium:alanine symporter family protein [Marinitenerispora sediminis]RCV62559.1 sodium:alanine symporter family protein [Marinitenerispora sediminis]
MTDSFQAVLDAVVAFIWGPFFLIPLLLVVGVYLTIRLRGLQFRVLGHALWLALIRRTESDKDGAKAEGDISHYQALSTALAATVGVGNIAGAALAIGVGGPGALFWMWVTGVLGMATKYSEALLGVKYRRPDSKGEMSGGPMFYLRHGFAEKFGSTGAGAKIGLVLGFLFALFGAVASFGIGNMTQANAVAGQLDNTFGVPTWISGIVMVALVAAVILGGIKSIGRFASGVVPVMIILYVLASLLVLAVYVTDIPGALLLVFTDAFSGTAAVGGFAGSVFIIAMQQGMARGMFSNESGLGTGGIAAAAAKTAQPVRQAMVSMTQTFIDTIIVVTMTGLVIIITGAWRTEAQAGDGALMTNWAMSEAFGSISPALAPVGGYIVAISLMFFAFTTLVGWSYYGERCLDFLVGRAAVIPFRIVFVIVVYIGATTELNLVWAFSDAANGLMAVPNLIGLLVLSGVIIAETRKYFAEPNWREPDLVDARKG